MDNFAPDNLLAPEAENRLPLQNFFFELFKVLVFWAVAVVIIRFFIFKPFVVKGASMEPNFHEKEYLIIDELTYRFAAPHRGDIIVLRSHATDDRDFFLKRIIGLPGDRVQIVNNRVKIYDSTHVDGFYLGETDYLQQSVITSGDTDVTLGSDEFFVLGDNRGASLDSRRIGPIQRKDVVGRVLLRGWPLNRIDYLVKDYYK